jgi:hypothetical protein
VAISATSGTSQFVEMAKASLWPDGAQALNTSTTALNVIGISLGDLDVFWKDQVDQLAFASKPGLTFRLTEEELRRAEDMWKRYQPVLQRVVSAISTASDAVQVNPVGAPQRRKAVEHSNLPPPTPPTSPPKKAGPFRLFKFLFG